MFGSIISERFYHVFSSFATCFACVSNAVLIYVIIVTHVNHVGPYRWLLLSFAVIDVLISLVHFALMPGVHMTAFGYIFWAYRMMEWPTEQAVWGMMVWVLLFYQTFVFTAFHYVYRFVLLCDPPWLSWINHNPWRNWITIASVAVIFYVGAITAVSYRGFYPCEMFRQELAPIMMEAYKIDLFAHNKPGFFGIVYWTRSDDGSKKWVASSIVTILALVLIITLSASVLAYCLYRIAKELAPSDVRLNSATISMQKQLFRALLWQTVIPTFTSYIPVGFVFVAPPLTGVAFGEVGTIMVMSTQIFPMIDPLIVLFFVQGYRKVMPLLIQRAVNATVELTKKHNSASSSVHPHT